MDPKTYANDLLAAADASDAWFTRGAEIGPWVALIEDATIGKNGVVPTQSHVGTMQAPEGRRRTVTAYRHRNGDLRLALGTFVAEVDRFKAAVALNYPGNHASYLAALDNLTRQIPDLPNVTRTP